MKDLSPGRASRVLLMIMVLPTPTLPTSKVCLKFFTQAEATYLLRTCRNRNRAVVAYKIACLAAPCHIFTEAKTYKQLHGHAKLPTGPRQTSWPMVTV